VSSLDHPAAVLEHRQRALEGGKVGGDVAAGDQEAAEAALRRANRAYDRAASKGVIHRNNAANHKARLARSVNRQGQ